MSGFAPVLLLLIAAASPLRAESLDPSRDALWAVVQCYAGRADSTVCHPLPAQLARDQDSIVIEDRNMSSCKDNAGATLENPASFVYFHALALPLTRATGVEDDRARQDEQIWRLAWRTAAAFVTGSGDGIVLVANPVKFRTQNQFHVHMVRLSSGARDEILQDDPLSPADKNGVEILHHRSPCDDPKNKCASRDRMALKYAADLSGVWSAAEDAARALDPRGLDSGDFGVAVVKKDDRYAVVAVDDSPEADFAVPCSGQPKP